MCYLFFSRKYLSKQKFLIDVQGNLESIIYLYSRYHKGAALRLERGGPQCQELHEIYRQSTCELALVHVLSHCISKVDNSGRS